MGRRWVVNASPLIVLGKVGLCDLPWRLADEIVVPAAVAIEITAGPLDDPARQWIEQLSPASITTIAALDPVVVAWDLGAGETEVIAYARRNPEFEAILDDRAARACARALNVPVRGTVALLLLARNAGIIERVGPLLPRLVAAGMFLSDGLIAEVLRQAGER